MRRYYELSNLGSNWWNWDKEIDGNDEEFMYEEIVNLMGSQFFLDPFFFLEISFNKLVSSSFLDNFIFSSSNIFILFYFLPSLFCFRSPLEWLITSPSLFICSFFPNLFSRSIIVHSQFLLMEDTVKSTFKA